jgi:Amt family ammonium transporter
VAITPACGWVGVGGALAIGALAGVVCLWGVSGLKKLLGADDALDVFGIHGIGGILGALLTGVFNTWSMGGTGIMDYVKNVPTDTNMMDQLIIQAQAVGTAIVWSGVVAFVVFKLIDMTMGLRVPEEQEREGLDTASHGERAYNY